MSLLLNSIDELITRATTSGDLREIDAAVQNVYEHLSTSRPEECNEGLKRLAPLIAETHPIPATRIALACGALVEHGGDPEIAAPQIFTLAPGILAGAARFYELCKERASADGLLPKAKDIQEGEDDDDDEGPAPQELAERYFGAIIEEFPEIAWSHVGEETLTLALISHLAHSKKLRAQARSIPELLDQSNELDAASYGTRSFLSKMLLVLDDASLLVLDSDQNKGYRAKISGIADNFQLHTVLMGRLFGDPAEGWIDAEGFDMDQIRRAMTEVCDKSSPIIQGAFNLWNWSGVLPDGKLPSLKGQDQSNGFEHWIWNEGVPADIATFEGERIVILGPPAYERSWRGGLIFNGMQPEFVVREKLSEEAVKQWFQKLGAAPKPPLSA